MLYFFDINEGGSLPDRQGLDLPDLSAAQAHALDIAMTYLRQQPEQFWQAHDWSIDIREGAGRSLYRLAFRLSIP